MEITWQRRLAIEGFFGTLRLLFGLMVWGVVVGIVVVMRWIWG